MIARRYLFLLFTGILISSCQSDQPSKRIIGSGTEVYKVEFIRVEGGEFYMGNDQGDKDEKPEHLVELNDFFISKHEITNGQFCKFLNAYGNHIDGEKRLLELEDEDCNIQYSRKGYYSKAGFINHPVIEVTWYGARKYAEWKGGRLPTEAEWEYAARGGLESKGYQYSGSNNPRKVAWFDENSEGRTHMVATKAPNELGLFDMSGNVWEWCSDFYRSNYYKTSTQNNPTGPDWGTGKVVRGGSWGYNETYLSPTYRKLNSINAGNFNLGFRIVKDVK